MRAGFYLKVLLRLSRQWGTLQVEQLKFNDQGLIPAIAQDYLDNTILMMAWMNRELIQRTLETGEAHYWSRSRSELWHKGATSGHIQKVKAMYYDCDADTLLLKIEQVGDVACHTGAKSCFLIQSR
jgi:phosphoribosyl-AMP cyclohydrolase/phosphoribosyl-ATP pyrophosphohydrolase/phosphoribosyl-AMP cyclohydrolase